MWPPPLFRMNENQSFSLLKFAQVNSFGRSVQCELKTTNLINPTGVW